MSGTRKPRARSQQPDPTRHPACTRCKDHYPVAAHWPEGPVCSYCYQAAKRTEGTCAGCGHTGMTPGRDDVEGPLYPRCSKIPLDLTCNRCGDETWLAKANVCWRCLLDDIVRGLLSGPNGTVSPELEPLAAAIIAMPRANSGVTWIHANPKVRELLRALGEGALDPTHEALDALPGARTVEFLRALMIEYGILPPRDRLLANYERWVAEKLETIADSESRQIVERFARWHHLRTLRTRADNATVDTGPFLRAKQSTVVAISFLNWLGEHDTTLPDCTQHHIDSWYASGPSTRQHTERFLYWSRSNRLTTHLDIPRRTTGAHELVTENERLRTIRTLLLHENLLTTHRIAGCLLALYGQSVGRIVTLTTDDLEVTDETVSIKLSGSWIELPEPLAAIVKLHIDNRPNTNTATNTGSRWLFPGFVPGDHLHRQSVIDTLRRAGIPVRATRNTTWQQLVRHAPPQVLAETLGVSATTAMDHARRAGSDWASYAALNCTTESSADPQDPQRPGMTRMD